MDDTFPGANVVDTLVVEDAEGYETRIELPQAVNVDQIKTSLEGGMSLHVERSTVAQEVAEK